MLLTQKHGNSSSLLNAQPQRSEKLREKSQDSSYFRAKTTLQYILSKNDTRR